MIQTVNINEEAPLFTNSVKGVFFVEKERINYEKISLYEHIKKGDGRKKH